MAYSADLDMMQHSTVSHLSQHARVKSPDAILSKNGLTLTLPVFFCFLKMLSAFKSAANILMHSRLLFNLEAHSMNSDQTSPKGAV